MKQRINMNLTKSAIYALLTLTLYPFHLCGAQHLNGVQFAQFFPSIRYQIAIDKHFLVITDDSERLGNPDAFATLFLLSDDLTLRDSFSLDEEWGGTPPGIKSLFPWVTPDGTPLAYLEIRHGASTGVHDVQFDEVYVLDLSGEKINLLAAAVTDSVDDDPDKPYSFEMTSRVDPVGDTLLISREGWHTSVTKAGRLRKERFAYVLTKLIWNGKTVDMMDQKLPPLTRRLR